MRAVKLNIRNLDTILRRTGLYEWMPSVRETKDLDFEKINEEITGDKDE